MAITFNLDNKPKGTIRLEKSINKFHKDNQHPNMSEGKHGEPITRRKRYSSTDDLCFSPPGMVSVETDLLKSINDKLGILELVSNDIKELKASLEMSDKKAATMEKETNKLKGTVNTTEMDVT